MSEDMSIEQVEYKYKCGKCSHEWTQVMQKHMGSSVECPKCEAFNPPQARRYLFEKEFTSFRA